MRRCKGKVSSVGRGAGSPRQGRRDGLRRGARRWFRRFLAGSTRGPFVVGCLWGEEDLSVVHSLTGDLVPASGVVVSESRRHRDARLRKGARSAQEMCHETRE